MSNFKAPWGPLLWVTTGLTGAMMVFLWLVQLPQPWFPPLPLMRLLVLLTVIPCALWTVRGYEIRPSTLLVRRLLWTTRVDLMGLKEARVEPGAMAWSLRLWGNEGLFAFVGWFQNKRLGKYRAWVTDRRRTVLLTFDKRKLVLSPHAPEEFVQALSSHLNGPQPS
jgi:hypothetical protein